MTPVNTELIGRGMALAGFDGDRRVVLVGPAGIGTSTLAAALAARRPAPAVWLRPQRADRDVPYAGLAELAGVLPAGPGTAAVGAAVAAGTGGDLHLRQLVAHLLGRVPPLVLVVDNAQWLDEPSAGVLGWALRQVPDLPVIAAERAPDVPRRAAALGGDAPRVWRVPPLTVDGVAELLAGAGVHYRWAGRVHALTGGNPALALRLAAPDGPLHAAEPALPAGVPELPAAVRELVGEWLAELPADARRTLTLAALAEPATVPLLHRLAGPAVDGHLAAAVAAGLATLGVDGRVAFPAGVVPAALVAGLPHAKRQRLHGDLASADDDPVRRARHAALAADAPAEPVAAEAERAAGLAHRRGDRALAAELSLLAAQRTPDAGGVPLDRALAAVRDAARAGDAGRARAAAGLVLDRSEQPPHRVAALLALLDTAGQDLADSDELFARAAAEAGPHPELLARVRVRESSRANVNGGDPARALALAAQAAELADRGGDVTTRALALTMQARTERLLGRPDAEAVLARALALPLPAGALDVHRSPRYLAVRHALFDDRLGDARAALLALLPEAERSGAVEDTVDVLRSLAEVEARAGACAAALRYAHRAVGLTDDAGLSPGPARYTAALAEAAGGDADRAADFARRGAAASEQEQDLVFLSRNLFALGQVLLTTDRPVEALAALERVRDLEAAQRVADPSVLRWHADLAENLAALGRTDEAAELIDRTRLEAAALDRSGVAVQLDRAAGLLAAGRGDPDAAAALLTGAAGAFAARGLPIEQGRTLLALGAVERRRRRRAAARAAIRRAGELFDAVGARPWARRAAAALRRLDPAGGRASEVALTDTEQRIADLVGRGAGNVEIAGTLSVSVKTVEATLTRVYRKLGVRSRVQLATRLRAAADPPP
ncbi:transcriptional regulator [Pilimelia anulata]|uniref:Transcriptional regulator n=1 Tax=Pilimelia anulata TaxID=53371 RepID=A0A8J3FFZ1_9ACTN|nr:LuxR family transcriptional regulator [Pilimelia anulata]GGK07150.1 transcriptional regulator [Pilimelia anulata]